MAVIFQVKGGGSKPESAMFDGRQNPNFAVALLLTRQCIWHIVYPIHQVQEDNMNSF